MKRELFRIGTEKFVNMSNLEKFSGLGALFDGYSEFVYVADFFPWKRVDGVWTGALGYLFNDSQNNELNELFFYVKLF
jgi:hypothetical protein